MSGQPVRSVLVTGSSRGIGRAIALKLAAGGYQVIVHCRGNRAAAEDTCAAIVRLGVQPGAGTGAPAPRLLQFDIADRAAGAAALGADMEAHGAYYGVVCNAGLARDGAFPALEDEDWDAVMRTNLDGFYNVLHPVVMPMIRRRAPGRLVTLSSVSGIAGHRGQVNYSASKAGIIGATKALAVELASRKITVNCVAPGLIRTDMMSDAPVEEVLKAVPMGRVGEPEEVAAVVNFLMSDEAAYITRQVIGINGGMI
jgi:3-oxoacyl-[acyl-carrier protein] reductase